MTKFTDLLDEYLDEREKQNGTYYDGRFIDDRMKGRWYMEDLAKQLNAMVQGVKE